MFNSENLNLPLVQAAQAQKHVTVNEALAKLDALVQLRLQTTTDQGPPVDSTDGQAFGVPVAATGDWVGQEGSVAIRVNGGWEFVPAKLGWCAWDIENARHVYFDGTNWVPENTLVLGADASSEFKVVEVEHDIVAGAANTTTALIPSHSLVFGVTARVTEAITGTGISNWSLGVSGATDRYGTGYGLSLNSYAKGLTSHPQTYWDDTELVIIADAGSFTSGKVTFAVHILELNPPAAV